MVRELMRVARVVSMIGERGGMQADGFTCTLPEYTLNPSYNHNNKTAKQKRCAIMNSFRQKYIKRSDIFSCKKFIGFSLKTKNVHEVFN